MRLGSTQMASGFHSTQPSAFSGQGLTVLIFGEGLFIGSESRRAASHQK